MGKMKDLLIGTIIGIVIKLFTLSIFSLVHIGMYSLLISVISGFIFTTLFDGYNLNKYLKYR